MGDYPMTRKGYEAMQKRLDHLKYELIPKAQERLGAARELGDLSENSEFDAAREELWRLDQQIAELEHQLAKAEVIDPSKVDKTCVSFGATVTVLNLDLNEKDTFTIVGYGEADLSNGRISVGSPLASGLIGAKEGETVEIDAPAGKRKLKILEFHYDA